MPSPPGLTATIEPLLQSPGLPALVEELPRVRAAEQARRERFYEALTEDTKAEFITSHVIRGFAVPVRAVFDPQVDLRTLAQLTQG